MKFSIPREALAGAANRVRPAANGRGGTDGMIRITALDGGSVRFEATDGTLTVRTTAGAEVAETGVVVIPSKVFCETVSFLDGEVSCHVEGTSLVIADAAGETKLAMIDDAQFVDTAEPAEEDGVTFPAGELAAAVRSVERAALRDRGNYPGVYFDSEKGSLRLVATDGFCLALVETGLPALAATPFVPAGELNAAMKVLDPGADVTVTADEARIAFDDGTTRVSVALLSAPFPQYRQLLGVKVVATVRTTASNLDAAVKRVRTVLDPAELRIRFDGDPVKGLGVSAESQTSGSSAVDVADAAVEGESLTFRVNPVFVAAALASLSDEVTLEYQEPGKAFVLSSGNTRWYVMPTRPNS